MHCLWCDQPFQPVITWVSLISADTAHLCPICQEKLQRIEGELCDICGRDLSLLENHYHQNGRCSDCQRWEENPEWAGILTKNCSLYHYNDFLKEAIARFKYRGDHAMAEAFKQDLKKRFNQTFLQFEIVPIPLSPEREYERGFNQAEVFAKLLGKPIHQLLARSHHEKQSKKSRAERMKLGALFQLHPDFTNTQDNILLIDDIYTTGSTLRHAAKVLKQHGAKQICSMTIARG